MAGAPLVVGATAVAALCGASLIASSAFLIQSQRVAGAADAAALAGGDTALGWLGGDPCTVAARVAEANGALLVDCVVDDFDVVVTASGIALGIPITRRARAGPASS
jgi:secretion/DNA translocation related TadE-like protein